MILIKGNWERVKDLDDVLQIIREYYNEDLADKMDELMPIHTDIEYESLSVDLYNREQDIEILDTQNTLLTDTIDKLKERIAELETQ